MTHNRRVPNLLLARPTIVQRVVLALLGAFFLVWLALLAYIYIEFRQALAVDQGLKKLGRALTAALAEVRDDAEARVVLTATATQFQTLRISGNPAGSVLMELRDRQGGVVHASPALGRHVLDGRQDEVIDQQIDGKTYWVYRATRRGAGAHAVSAPKHDGARTRLRA